MAKKRTDTYEVTVLEKPKSITAEAYRALRTNLGFAGIDQTYRSILVSSPSPRDGKSTVAANLAVVLAQAGGRVMLVDCDLRKPVQHKIFLTENIKGLTNCLLQQVPFDKARYRTRVDNLGLLTSGPLPPNPAELLNSQRVKDFWPMLLDNYDYVVVDAPPVLAVTDASILAPQMNGVIIVTRYGVTRKEQVHECREQFIKANANIIGVVLNQAKIDSEDYGYYYYYSQENVSAS